MHRFFIPVLIAAFFISSQLHAQVFIPFGFWSCKPMLVISNTDNTATSFSAGTFSNTTLSGNSVVLSTSQVSGTYTSAVKDILCSQTKNWKSHEWTTDLPYGKELPATGEITADYNSVSTTLMNNLVGLWHLNEATAGLGTGATDATDFSTGGNHLIRSGTGHTFGATGKLFKVIGFNGSGYLAKASPTATVRPTGNTYSFSGWVRRRTNTATGSIFQCGPSGGFNIGIGVTPYSGNQIKLTKYAVVDITAGTFPANTNWHHLSVVYSSTGVTVYIDGVVSGTNANNANFAACTGSLGIGGSEVQFNGDIDEVAVWSRAITAAEVLQLYRRGINRIKFQVRSCTSNNCADNPVWLGPDGSSATYFTEINNNSAQFTSTGTVQTAYPIMTYSNFSTLFIPQNRYFQYQATLETDSTTYSPLLKSVTVKR
jgi:hypothetical protein